jgi:hypothetical protein
MRSLLVVTIYAVTGCQAAPAPAPLVRHPKGYAGRMADAEEHSQRAEQHRQAAGDPGTPGARADHYDCGDTDLSDQTTSGGERLVASVPCWDLTEESAEHQRFLAEREQALAQAARRAATRLVEAELAACRGIPPRELEHSPFAHKKEIADVIPHREAGVIRGVRIIFKPVPGLTVAWMRQAIACHRARFERLGEPAIYLPDDPTLVANATATVGLHEGQIEVFVETADDTNGQVAFERAMDLVRPRTAGR